MKNDPKESFRTYVKRFKAEKAKIVRCDDSITCSAFRKRLPADHPLFRELVIGENLTLANSYALAKNHSFWDEAKRSQKLPENLRKDVELTQKKVDNKLLNNKDKPRSKNRDRSSIKGGSAPKTYTKFSVPINRIIHDLKDKSWFKMSPPRSEDTSKMNQTKYCAFHRVPGHTTNGCTIWMKYLEKLVKEGKYDQYVDRLAALPR
ncbi:hypothetical protein ACFX2F_001369 [Malus domestica]